MQTNKVTTYILYAIGEIILVVVGILIAVSIDNWNESRKQRDIEVQYLINLRKDLMADFAALDTLINNTKQKKTAAKRIGMNAKSGEVESLYTFAEDMKTMLFVKEFFPNQNTYEELQSSGNFSLIQNEEIKIKLLALNETYVQTDFYQRHNRNDYELMLEAFERHVSWGFYFDTTDMSDLEVLVFDSTYVNANQASLQTELDELFTDKIFINSMFFLELNHGDYFGWFQDIHDDLTGIMELIDAELEVR